MNWSCHWSRSDSARQGLWMTRAPNAIGTTLSGNRENWDRQQEQLLLYRLRNQTAPSCSRFLNTSCTAGPFNDFSIAHKFTQQGLKTASQFNLLLHRSEFSWVLLEALLFLPAIKVLVLKQFPYNTNNQATLYTLQLYNYL